VKTLKKIFEPILISSVILAMAIANVWQVIYYWWHNPSGTIYIGIAHYYQDYLYYLSQVTQGAMGSWMVRNIMTSEPIPATPLWWTNILLGKISWMTGIPVWKTYDYAIIVTSLISLILTYYGAKILYPKNAALRIGTFLAATLTTDFYTVMRNPDGSISINPYVYFYNYTGSLNRLGGVVHLMLQNIFSLGVILAAAEIFQVIFNDSGDSKKLIRLTIITGILAFGLTYINPMYIAVDAIAIAVTAVLFLIIKPHRLKSIGRLLLVGIIIGVPLLIPTSVMLQTFTIPFYQYFRAWEASVWSVNQTIFFSSALFVAILFPVGIIPFIRRFDPLRVLGLIWALLPVYLYFSPIPLRLGLPYFRLHQPPSYLIFGAVIAEALYVPGAVLGLLNKKITIPLFCLLLTVFIALQLPMIRMEILQRMENTALPNWINHVDQDTYNGLLFLKKLPGNGIAMGLNNIEFLIPVVSGKTVYAAHLSLTLGYGNKIADVARFITAKMSENEAHDFLITKNIRYILWRKVDGIYGFTNYPFLKLIYENPGIEIYTLK
jgi:hypothetical protein